MKKYFSNKTFSSGFFILSVLIVILIAEHFFSPFSYDEIDTQNKFAPFSREHIFGTDYLGRDIFSRVITGMKISLSIGFSVMVLSFAAGTVIGAAGGFFGGIADSVVSKLVDTQMAFPGILLALMLTALFSSGTPVTVFALVLMSTPKVIRIARSGFIKYKNSLFVLSAKAKGASNLRIICLYIFPNIMPDLLVTSTLNFSLSILSESSLSYLGLGIQPPLSSFGRMLSENQRFILQAPSNILVPAVFLTALVLSFNLIDDGISEANQT